ncbi:MAG: hypothetical protein RQ751_12315 [Longimicrobiales bacterium]|nr:hypothetical protein [Longimicrobiales bacterium]
MAEGRLLPLRKGLYLAPKHAFWGTAHPTESELLRAFFAGRPYLRTGPSVWNSLGLGTTAVEARPLVYNTTRTGTENLAGRTFELRRVRFPRSPDPEFFVVDLLSNVDRMDQPLEEVLRHLGEAVREERFDTTRLREMAAKFGTAQVQAQVDRAVEG